MLDFTKTKKKFLNVKLIDGNTVMVRMPTKKIFDELIDLEDNLRNLDMGNREQIEEVYNITARVLSNNLQNKEISSEYLSEIFDVEDISILFSSYINFVKGRSSDPNSKSLQSQEKEAKGTIDAQQSGKD